MKTTMGVLMGLWVMSGLAVAQEARPPALLVKGEDGTSVPLRVDELDVAVSVVGNVAETVMTLRFRNDTDRVLEGELVFPLGEGRTVSRYGLEVNGRIREGVSIPKKRGRAVFESVVRKEIDPGLLEWTKGNNFRTRVYPIPAKGFKSVRVGYEEELNEENGKYVYRLPLDFQEAVGTFRMRVEVERLRMAANEIEVEGLKLQRRKARTVVMEAEEKNFAADRAIVVRLAPEEGPSVLVEERDGEQFFYVVDQPGMREEFRNHFNKTKARRPSSMRLVWDASNSGAARDRAKELDLLGRYLAWAGDVSVTLVWLRNDLVPGGVFAVKGGEWSSLRKVLEGVRYDGGTRLGLLDFQDVGEEVVVLVSDGVSTLGKGEIEVGRCPVLVMHGARSAEYGALHSVAARSGGACVNLSESSVEDGFARLTGQQFSLLSVQVEAAGVVTEVHPSMRQAVSGPVGVAGKLDGEKAVTLLLRYGWEEQGAVVHRVVVDPKAHGSKSGRVPRLWAQKKLADLEVDAEQNRDAILDLAKAHGLVTRFTSLIVLDGIEDYVEHRIVPPESEMRKEYEELLKDAPDEDRGNPEHLKEMLALWKKRCEWHETKFPGLAKVLFLRFDQVAPDMEELRKELRELEEAKEALDGDEEKLLAMVKEKLKEFDALKTEVAKLRAVPPGQQGAEWLTAVKTVSGRLTGVMDGLENTARESAAGGGAADPFGAPETLGGALLRRGLARNDAPVPAPAMVIPSNGSEEGGDDPFSSDAESEGAMVAEEYEPPELPNSVGGGRGSGGAGLFPVTPATPAAFETRDTGGEITLAKWDPKTPYLEALKKVGAGGDLEAVYFEWKEQNAGSSAFFLDVADFFMERKEEKLALRILTNVAEMDTESVPLLRILGHRLDQLGELKLAELVFREVKDLRSDEPQSWRDLALVLEKRERYQEALDLLWSMVIFEWDRRFPEVQLIALMELNALVARQGESLDLSAVDERFLKNLDCDVRIVLTWDADNTDMDLWVTGPAGQKCFYGEPETLTGGRMSQDFTQGYGPEEFVIRRALPGSYRVDVDYYGNRQQVLAGATTIQAVLVTNWGRPNEKREAVTLRLKDAEEMVKVAELMFGGAVKD